MTFDLKQCMEQDGGKCVYVCIGDKHEAKILCDNIIDVEGGVLAVVVKCADNITEDLFQFKRSGYRHGVGGADYYYLENLPKTHEVNVFIVEYSDGVREIKTQTSGDYIGPLKVLGSSKFTMTEGEFIETDIISDLSNVCNSILNEEK